MYLMKMEQVKEFSIQFVEYMPDIIKQGILYVSMQYSVIIHLCACGCGEKVVTPLSSEDWQLYYDGETISLYPSIGNWDFSCRSHYWIRRNKIIYAKKWEEKEIKIGKKKKKNNKKRNTNT